MIKLHIDKKRYIILMMIICFVISASSSILFLKIKDANAKERDVVHRESIIEKDQKDLTDEKAELDKEKEAIEKLKDEVKSKEDELKVKESDLKTKEDNLNKKEQELKDKEEALKQREAELKAKEEEIAKKLAANRPAPPNNGGDMVAYLTFDDGPSANTERILDILAANNIKATFFVNGHIGFENTYQRIVNEGHKIGNHTYSHDYGEVYSSIDSFFNSINKLNEYLSSLGIGGSDIIRFPGGSNNTVSVQYGGVDLMDRLVNQAVINGYDYFDWNVSSGDANKITEDKEVIINNVKKGCAGKRNPVILMHDSAPKTTTADGLQEIIDYLKGQGYSFGTLENGIGLHVKFK